MENTAIKSSIPIEDIPMDSSRKVNRKPIIIGLIAGAVLVGVIGYFLIPKTGSVQENKLIQAMDKVLPTPTPGPFVDMTIPYLRSKNYDGKLGERSQVNTNGSYASYLTSYTSDGLKINGVITIPSGEKPEKGWPAIIFIHGYIPPTIYQTLTNYTAYVDYLARNGFVVFKIDLRGHADSEGEASGAYYSGDYIVDALNAYTALQKDGQVNPDGIGIWGHSMAGNVTLRTLAAKPTIPAAVIWAGAVYTYQDMQEFGIQDNSYRPPTDNTNRQRKRDLLFKTYGQFDPKSPFWKTVVATNYLDEIQGAIQLDHAVDDDVVSVEYSRGLDRLLDRTKVEHELHEYPSGGHNINGASFNVAMKNTVEFFKKHLQ